MVGVFFLLNALFLALVPGAVRRKDLVMDNKPQSPMEGRNVNEMNARGALYHSSVRVVKASELVLPFKGWYPGREYYIVPRGLDVGVFVDM